MTEWEVRLVLPLLPTGLCTQIDLRGFFFFFFFCFFSFSPPSISNPLSLPGISMTRLPLEFELLDPSKIRFIYLDTDDLTVHTHAYTYGDFSHKYVPISN